MKPSVPQPNRKTVSRTAARNAALINQFATPGLGSLMVGRWIAGTGQLLLALAGFAFVIKWFFETMVQAFNQISGDVSPQSVAGVGETGAVLFLMAWFWALVTSISLVTRAKSEEPPVPQTIPPPAANPPAEPPILTE
jgi:hypothetical protein